MHTYNISLPFIPIPLALKIVGIIGGILGLLGPLLAVWTYMVHHPDFSIFTVYLSELGSTPGITEVIFNAGMLVSAPIRLLVGVLLALRLAQLGARRNFFFAFMILSLIATIGIITMSAAPFRTMPDVHNFGIQLFFPGTVLLQLILVWQERKLPQVPRILSLSSLSVLLSYLVFAILLTLMQNNLVSHDTPIIWEWLCFATQLVWVFAHSIILGKKEE